MSLRKFKFRESIVPDLSVKILDLCLNSDENGIAAPSTRRRAYSFEYGADQILKEVISKRIENHAKPVPLSQRKRSIYEQALKENTKKEVKDNNIVKDIYVENTQKAFDNISSVVSIVMRKHMMCLNCALAM